MKLGKVASLVCTAALTVTSTFATAGLLSGTHTTDGLKSVDLQGLEWMSLDYTAGISRDDIEDGFTDRYGTVWAANDWTYASRAQTETLLGSLWGGVYSGWSNDNYDGAQWFLDNFGALSYDIGVGYDRVQKTHTDDYWTTLDSSGFLFGHDTECTPDTDYGCAGWVHSADGFYTDLRAPDVLAPPQHGTAVAGTRIGYFHESYGVDMSLYESNDAQRNTFDSVQHGSLLVRSATVPEPGSLALLGLGLAGLGFSRRKAK